MRQRPTPMEIAEGESALDKHHKVLEKAIGVVRREKKIAERAVKKMPRLRVPFISKSIYTAGTIGNQTNRFTRLPQEIHNMISKQLPENTDRVTLALTCKTQAGAYEALKIETNKSTYAHRPPARFTKVHRLKLLVRIKHKQPANFRLCYKCVRFIDLNHPDNLGQWGGDPVRVADGMATEAAMILGPRCPLCVEGAKIELAQHKQAHRKFLKIADSVHFKSSKD